MSLLAAEPADLGDGHSVNAALHQCIFDVLELEVTNQRFDFIHGNGFLSLD